MGAYFAWALVAVAAGIAASVQGAANAGLGTRIGIGNAVLINGSFVIAASAVLWLSGGARLTLWQAGVSWTQYAGGLCGFVIILAAAYVFPKTGGAVAIGFMVLGQGLMALAIDHWGLLGMPRIEMTWPRLAGIGLLCGGVALLRW